MKKRKKLIVILIIIIITILGLMIYDFFHYSKKEVLEIINRSYEKFDNIYIKQDTYNIISSEEYVTEIYAKDNFIYDYAYSYYSGPEEAEEFEEYGTDIWNFEAKEKITINHKDKTINVSKIRGKRTS